MAKNDIKKIIDLSPEHISYYQLTIEPNTKFFYDKPNGLPSSDKQNLIQEDCLNLLEKAGYERYEISAFSKKNFECKHNLNYWRFGDYIAVGAGAHGKYRLKNDDMIRYQNASNPNIYMKNLISNKSCHKEKLLSNSDKIFEFMLNNLRLMSGFSVAHFESATGLKYDVIEKKLSELNNLKLMQYYPSGYWKPTALGFKFLDNLQSKFLQV
jgi:Coproporphyrinogen III oxidase and related Fe-S oxidoreductases